MTKIKKLAISVSAALFFSVLTVPFIGLAAEARAVIYGTCNYCGGNVTKITYYHEGGPCMHPCIHGGASLNKYDCKDQRYAEYRCGSCGNVCWEELDGVSLYCPYLNKYFW